MTTLKIHGDKQLRRALEALPDRVYRKVVRQSMGKAATPIQKAVRQNAKKLKTNKERVQRKRKDGTLLEHLHKTIVRKTRTYTRNHTILTTVGPKWPQGAHGHLVEWGHRIVTGGTLKGSRKKSARAGQGRVSRRGLFRRASRTRAFPWMTPGFKSASRQSLAIMQRELKAKVEAAANELRTKSA